MFHFDLWNMHFPTCIFYSPTLLFVITYCHVFSYRLGETDKALYHYKQAGPDADPDEIVKAKTLQVYLNKCTEARRFGDWITLITATNNAISSGADSAPQVSYLFVYFFY